MPACLLDSAYLNLPFFETDGQFSKMIGQQTDKLRREMYWDEVSGWYEILTNWKSARSMPYSRDLIHLLKRSKKLAWRVYK